MKKNLDLNRLGMVIRWDVLNNWTYNLGIIAGLAICFSIANIIRLYRISGFIAASHELDALTDSYKKSAYMFFGFISFMVIYVLASCIFRNMKTKLQRESFLMLPATNLEKYVARFLVVTVGGLVTLLGALVISDIIQLIFSFFHHSRLPYQPYMASTQPHHFCPFTNRQFLANNSGSLLLPDICPFLRNPGRSLLP